jgi:hypothetical protein
MQIVKAALFASSLVLCGALAASAQSASSTMNGTSAATDTPALSAATHCRDAQGNIQRKSSTTGSAAPDSSGAGASGASASNSSGSSPLGSAGSSGPTGLSTGPGSSSPSGGSTTAAADLPNCKR